jgi:hypothetical protein
VSPSLQGRTTPVVPAVAQGPGVPEPPEAPGAPDGGRRRPLWLAATAALAAAALACGGGGGGGEGSPGAGDRAARGDRASAPSEAGSATSTPTTSSGGSPTPPPRAAIDGDAADPVRVEIPGIGVSAPVIPLDLDAAGALEVPTDFADTGWWAGGPEPGEQGPAVVVGHVDSVDGPAVFHRLPDLRPGDVVTIHRSDGTAVDFVVDRLEQHPKAAFPTEAVYGPTEGSELRLITCGGEFDRSSRHYLDNHIAFAHRR